MEMLTDFPGYHCRTDESTVADVNIFNIAQIEALPVTVDQLGHATRRDVDLSQVWQYVQLGWPDVVPECLKPHSFRSDELTVQGNVLMWGIRVIVPNKLQLHREHPGVVRMKSIDRSYVWWPGVDQAIERVVKACSQCQVVSTGAPHASMDLACSAMAENPHRFRGSIHGETVSVGGRCSLQVA